MILVITNWLNAIHSKFQSHCLFSIVCHIKCYLDTKCMFCLSLSYQHQPVPIFSSIPFQYSIKLEIQKNQDVSFTPSHPSATDKAIFQVSAESCGHKSTHTQLDIKTGSRPPPVLRLEYLCSPALVSPFLDRVMYHFTSKRSVKRKQEVFSFIFVLATVSYSCLHTGRSSRHI